MDDRQITNHFIHENHCLDDLLGGDFKVVIAFLNNLIANNPGYLSLYFEKADDSTYLELFGTRYETKEEAAVRIAEVASIIQRSTERQEKYEREMYVKLKAKYDAG